jgi:glycosyltransferase involved in cell wall biosynthesis
LNKTKKSKQLKRILFLENQPSVHSGAHYRVEILRKFFQAEGIEMDVHYPFNPIEFKEKPSFKSFRKHLEKKFDVIRKTPNYDLIVVRRELVHQIQYGNLFLDKLLLSYNENVILDMDDYMPDLRSHLAKRNNSVYNQLNFFNSQKNKHSFALYKFYTLAIDEFKIALIQEGTGVYERNIHIFPMSLDYNDSIKEYKEKNKVVGWLSQSIHFKRIDKIIPYLNAVYEKYPFELHIVADKPYSNSALNVPVVNKKWSLDNERQNMQLFDVGIAPIDSNQDLKSRKGTFKLIQYMALGIVSLTTYLTYCDKLIEEGKSGFLIHDESDWESKLLQILQLSPSEMNSIKEIAFETFRKTHHIDIQANLLIDFYKSICQ